MTKEQSKFLKAIYNQDRTAEELCEILKIDPSENDPIGGYYNALNKHIDYIQSDDKSAIDDMFKIIPLGKSKPNEDVYRITLQGKTYIENCNLQNKRHNIQIIIGVITIFITVIIFLIQYASN